MKERFFNLVKSMLTRKFLLAVVSAVFTACNYIFAWGLTESQIAMVLAPIGAWILAEGTADVAERIKTTVSTVRVTQTPQDGSDEPEFTGALPIVTGSQQDSDES